jgi:hypothetical protein
MPRPAKLPDLSDVDITELKLMILAALERAWHGAGMAPAYARRADWRHARPMRRRPAGARAEQRDELAASHSITSSAMASRRAPGGPPSRSPRITKYRASVEKDSSVSSL